MCTEIKSTERGKGIRERYVSCTGGEDVHAYCLFCETMKCETIAHRIEMAMGFQCISPKIVQRKWIRGIVQEEAHDWLPGYIFVYTEEPVQPHFRENGVIRCLGNDELHGSDLAFAMMLFTRGGVIGTIPLVEEGDRCKVADAAWYGLSGTVVKLDRGRKRCCMEFNFDDKQWHVWLGYELVEKN